jgi:hypothetical protein
VYAVCENVGKSVHAKLHCSDEMPDLTTAKPYENITLGIFSLSELCLMCTTFRKLTLIPSSGEINTIVIKLTVWVLLMELMSAAVPFPQHRACQVGPIPQAQDNV